MGQFFTTNHREEERERERMRVKKVAWLISPGSIQIHSPDEMRNCLTVYGLETEYWFVLQRNVARYLILLEMRQ